MKHYRFAALLLSFAVPAIAQQSDFTARYGDPAAEQFVVRPGITLMVEYGTSRVACRMLIEPKHSILRQNESAMRPEVVTEILDEVLPQPDRGMQLRHVVTKSGCNEFEITEYENATITRTTHRAISQILRSSQKQPLIVRRQRAQTSRSSISAVPDSSPCRTIRIALFYSQANVFPLG